MADTDKPEPFSLAMAPLPVAGAKRPSSFFNLPDDFLMLIAQIALTWGAFEHDFDELLAAMQRAAGTNNSTLRLGYPRKSTMLLERCDRVFKHGSDIFRYIEEILTDASGPYLERNLIIHGQASVRIDTGEPVDGKIPATVRLVFQGEKDGLEVFDMFDIERLIALLQTIAHACGRLKALLKNSDSLPFSSLDRSSLQAFLDRDYRPSPIPTMPPHQHGSSGG